MSLEDLLAKERMVLEDLLMLVERGRQEGKERGDRADTRMDRLEQNVELAIGQTDTILSRISTLETRATQADARIKAHSERARAPSTHDLKTEAALAAEIVERKRLERSLKVRLTAIATHPVVKGLGPALAAFVAAWIAAHGGHP